MIRIGHQFDRKPRPELQGFLSRVGGKNIYGQPIFRLTWPWQRLVWIGGEWDCYDGHGNWYGTKIEYRLEPKYFGAPLDRWLLEKWVPWWQIWPFKQLWESQTVQTIGGCLVETEGPFPAQGDWELSETLMSSSGGYIEPTVTLLDWIMTRVLARERFSRSQCRAAIQRKAAKEEKAQDDLVEEMVLDSFPAFGGRLAVPVTKEIACSFQE